MKRTLIISLALLGLAACLPVAQQTPSTVALSETPQPLSTETLVVATDNSAQTSQFYEDVQDISAWPQTALDPAYAPQDVYENTYVSLGPDGEIYLINVSNDPEVQPTSVQITSDGLPKFNAVLSEQYMAWFVQVGEEGEADLFVFDRETDQQEKIALPPAIRMQLVLSGSHLVWIDKRNEAEASYTDFDLYGYDLATDTEIAIAVAPGAQTNPSLFGNQVVWQDNRNSPALQDYLAGCGNCPNNRFDIYLYDFETDIPRAIVESEWLKTEPSIYEDQVVWAEYRTVPGTDLRYGMADLYLLDLQTDQIQQMTTTPASETSPVLTGNHLLWTIREACDVVLLDADGKEILAPTGVYLLDLKSSLVVRLSDAKEPVAYFDSSLAIIQTGCMTSFNYIAIPLGLAVSEPPPTLTPSPPPTSDLNENTEVVFTIADDEPASGLAGAPAPDWLGWGGQALTIAPDGSFWLLDTASVHPSRLLQFSSEGDLLLEIDLQDSVVGAVDVAVAEEKIWVLGTASQPPKIVEFNRSGERVAEYPLSTSAQPSNLWLGEEGDLWVADPALAAPYQFLDANGEVAVNPLQDFSFGGHLYRVLPQGLGQPILVSVDEIEFEITSVTPKGRIAGGDWLGARPDGSFYVTIQHQTCQVSKRLDESKYV